MWSVCEWKPPNECSHSLEITLFQGRKPSILFYVHQQMMLTLPTDLLGILSILCKRRRQRLVRLWLTLKDMIENTQTEHAAKYMQLPHRNKDRATTTHHNYQLMPNHRRNRYPPKHPGQVICCSVQILRLEPYPGKVDHLLSPFGKMLQKSVGLGE